MTHTPLSSSMLASAGYENGIIEIVFNKNPKVYQYAGTQELFNQLVASESPGKFFNEYLKKAIVKDQPRHGFPTNTEEVEI